MTRIAIISALLLAACASSPSSMSPSGAADSPERVCSETPKNCKPMPKDAYKECVSELKQRMGSVCYDKFVALKSCFVTMNECDESGEIIENDPSDGGCRFENGELEACCAENEGDAACQF